MVYSHQEYQTKLAWNLPKLQEILDAYEEEDYGREIDLTPCILQIFIISISISVFKFFIKVSFDPSNRYEHYSVHCERRVRCE